MVASVDPAAMGERREVTVPLDCILTNRKQTQKGGVHSISATQKESAEVYGS